MNQKKVSKVIAYVLLVAALIMAAGLILTFTRGGTTGFKTFYAEHNGKKLFGDEQLSLPAGEEQRFDVKYTFDAFVEEEQKDYTVSIVTHGTEANKFTYTADGEPYVFDASTEMDVSQYFSLSKQADHFTMQLPADFSMSAVLGWLHEGKTIEVAKSVDVVVHWYFAIKIQSYNGENTIVLPFRQAPEEFDIELQLTGVKADKKNPEVALGGYNETKLTFTFEEGFGPEEMYVFVERCGSFEYALEDEKLIITIIDPGPGVKVTVTALQHTYKLVADELVGVQPVKDNPDTIRMGTAVLLTFTMQEGYELTDYDSQGGYIRLEEQEGNTLIFKLGYDPGEYGDLHYCIYAAPIAPENYPLEVKYTSGAITPDPQNATEVPTGEYVQLTFTVNSGYVVGNVTATGAAVAYEQSGQTLTVFVADPTADVVVTIQTRPVYEITTDLTGVTANVGNDTELVDGSNAVLYFTSMEDYALPATVTVTNARYQWDQSTGRLELRDPSGPITVTIEGVSTIRPSYAITTNLINVTANDGNDTELVDSSNAILYFTAKSGYTLPDSVTVTGARFQWTQSTGKLELRDPTGPITVTVEGVEIVPNSYAITTSYTAGHFTADPTNVPSIEEGTTVHLKFTISSNADFGTVTATGATVSHTVSGQVLTVTLKNPTGPVTVTITSRPMYSITTNLSNVSAVSGNATTIIDGLSATLYFTADSGYSLPGSVTVTNAGYIWTQSTGKLVLRDPTGPITVTVVGVEIVPERYEITTSYTAGHFTPYSSNVTTIEEGGTVQLKFTISSNVDFGTVTATGATVSHTISGQVLTMTLKNPTGPVTVTMTSRPMYSITTNLSNVSAVSGNATTIIDGLSTTLYFTADSGYSLPNSVTVTNAGYTWTQSTGKLVLRDPTGSVTITVKGVEILPDVYAIYTVYTASHFVADASNPTAIEERTTVQLKFTISSNADFGTVTATGATVSHTVSGQVLTVTLKNPTGPVTVTITSRPMYSITTNLSNVSSVSGNATSIVDGLSATLYFTADTGYSLPASVTVTNARYEWTQSTGKLLIRDASGPVTVTVVGVSTGRPTYAITTKLTRVTANAGNDTTLTDGSNAILYFTAVEGYLLPDTVTVVGARYQWDQTTGKLELRDPTGAITVTVVGVTDPNYRPSYSITVYGLGVTASSSNPTIIYDGSSATLYFTAKIGYSLPASVTVSGAGYQWTQSAGKLVLRDPAGDVTVHVIGTSGDSEITPITPIEMALPVQEEKYSVL